MCNALVETICETLGFQISENLPYCWDTSDLSLTLTSEPLGAIGARLDIDMNIDRKVFKTKKGREQEMKRRLHQAIRQRTKQIAAQISPVSSETVATFIELDNLSGDDDDPKHAIRIGFARVNRVTQFITPIKPATTDEKEEETRKNLAHRARASFLDLLRQLGVQAGEPQIPLPQLPEPLHYVGLWLIRKNAPSSATRMKQILPVLVYMSSDSLEIKAIAHGLKDWQSYSQTLLNIAQGKAGGFDKPRQAMPFIKEKLNEVVSLGEGNTLLLCHAQKFRQAWSWLNNTNIMIDQLAFGKEKPQSISKTQWKGLRIVRIRDSINSETPEWYAQKEDNEYGFAKGLFKMGARVFASTYGKPPQFSKYSKRTSKISFSTNSEGKQCDPAPYVPAWNPGLFELTVACIQPGDDAWTWAAVAHELRNLALHYDATATALPLPLHLGKLMEEYTLPLPDSDN